MTKSFKQENGFRFQEPFDALDTAAIVARAEASGISLRLEGKLIVAHCHGLVPPALGDFITAHRPAVVAELMRLGRVAPCGSK